VPLAALAIVGTAISFLGAFYYYVLDFAAKKAGQNTLEWITGDYDWNHVQFNARLLRIWLSGHAGSLASFAHIGLVSSPERPAMGDLGSGFLPNTVVYGAILERFQAGLVLKLFRMYVTSLVLGLVFLTWVLLRVLTEQRIATVGEFAGWATAPAIRDG
jgi:hypothetical protein